MENCKQQKILRKFTQIKKINEFIENIKINLSEYVWTFFQLIITFCYYCTLS